MPQFKKTRGASRPAVSRPCERDDAKRSNPKAATPLDKQIGHRLRALRVEKDRSLASLGRELGISGSQLGKYELGHDRIPLSRLFDAAHFLGKNYVYFLSQVAQPGLGEEEQSALEPESSGDLKKLIEEFAKIDAPELRSLAIDLVAKIAKPKRRDLNRHS